MHNCDNGYMHETCIEVSPAVGKGSNMHMSCVLSSSCSRENIRYPAYLDRKKHGNTTPYEGGHPLEGNTTEFVTLEEDR